MSATRTSKLSDQYPNVHQWIYGGGWIEIGEDQARQSFAKAFDEGGMVWEGKRTYRTLEDALQALDEGIAAWLEEHG